LGTRTELLVPQPLVELALLGYESFSFMVETLELSLDKGIEYANLFKGCELLRFLFLERGERGVGGDMPLIPLLAQMFELLLADDEDLSRFLDWVRCDKGTDVDDDEVFTVFTLVSDSARSFLTASGECVPKMNTFKIRPRNLRQIMQRN
jgi:hypothetical protein